MAYNVKPIDYVRFKKVNINMKVKEIDEIALFHNLNIVEFYELNKLNKVIFLNNIIRNKNMELKKNVIKRHRGIK